MQIAILGIDLGKNSCSVVGLGAGDVADTLQIALKVSGLSHANVRHRPRLLSDNGPSYVSSELGQWLDAHGMAHSRGRPRRGATRARLS